MLFHTMSFLTHAANYFHIHFPVTRRFSVYSVGHCSLSHFCHYSCNVHFWETARIQVKVTDNNIDIRHEQFNEEMYYYLQFKPIKHNFYWQRRLDCSQVPKNTMWDTVDFFHLQLVYRYLTDAFVALIAALWDADLQLVALGQSLYQPLLPSCKCHVNII